MNKIRCNFNRNSCIFIQENRFENVVWKMAAILSRPQYVNFIRCCVRQMHKAMELSRPVTHLHSLINTANRITRKHEGGVVLRRKIISWGNAYMHIESIFVFNFLCLKGLLSAAIEIS